MSVEKKNILAIYCSPRENSISGALLNKALEAFQEIDFHIVTLYIRDFTIEACDACEICYNGEECPIDDDMKKIYQLLERADALILASPVYFYGFPAKAKAMIDRCQLFWARKYLLNKPIVPKKPAVAIFTAASKGNKVFEGIRLTAKYFLDSISSDLLDFLALRGYDNGVEEITQEDYKRSYVLGQRLINKIDRELS